jgi:hypothetical protein
MELKPLFVFPRWSNKLTVGLLLFLMTVPVYLGALVTYGLDPVTLNSGYMPAQPIPYSHALHVGQLGIDCRYCHNTVEKAGFAAIPPTETCMNCHRAIRPNSDKLAALRESYKTGKPIPWVKIHDLPDYVYFNHAAHVNASVSCVECHGNINHMEQVYQVEPLNMAWCLQCHRDPEARIRPRDQVTNLDWKPEVKPGQTLEQAKRELGKKLMADYHINPSVDCVTCHR